MDGHTHTYKHLYKIGPATRYILFHPRINSDKHDITLVGQVLDSTKESSGCVLFRFPKFLEMESWHLEVLNEIYL